MCTALSIITSSTIILFLKLQLKKKLVMYSSQKNRTETSSVSKIGPSTSNYTVR